MREFLLSPHRSNHVWVVESLLKGEGKRDALAVGAKILQKLAVEAFKRALRVGAGDT